MAPLIPRLTVYAPMKDDGNTATGFASPCVGLAFAPKAMATGEVSPFAGSRVCASCPLQKQVRALLST